MSNLFKSLELDQHEEIYSRPSLYTERLSQKNSYSREKYDANRKQHLFFYDKNKISSLDKSPFLKEEAMRSLGTFMKNYSKILPKMYKKN